MPRSNEAGGTKTAQPFWIHLTGFELFISVITDFYLKFSSSPPSNFCFFPTYKNCPACGQPHIHSQGSKQNVWFTQHLDSICVTKY